MITFSGPLGLFWNIVVLNPELGGVSNVASAIISHEQIQSNRTCCFQTSDAVSPKGLFSDYLAQNECNDIDRP